MLAREGAVLRKLGLIGGMSWYSTRTYYEHINRIVQGRTTPISSAPLLIESMDFAPLARASSEEDWARAAQVLGDSAVRLEQAGAGAVVIAANSMHRVYDEVAARVSIPVIHIADCVGQRMEANGVKVAALLGPRNVMLEDFYRHRLIAHGVTLLPPEVTVVDLLDRVIYDELVCGKVTRAAERSLRTIVTNLEKAGARAIVLAGTELDSVVDVDANVLPIYDGALIHAEAAAQWILG